MSSRSASRALSRAVAAGVVACLACVAGAAPAPPAHEATAASPPKVLRFMIEIAETGFDPSQTADIYSHAIYENIFDAPLRFDYLARPIKVRPNTTTGLPEVSADFRTFTIHVRPGIFFADDPAFKGKKRELVAADFAFALRRHFDPKLPSVVYPDLLNEQILGLEALREKARKDNTPFDYDSPVEGLQVLDRYTLRIRLGRASPRFTLKLAQCAYACAIAREVAEAYGDAIAEHPVGTGPYKLAQWRRSSFIALDRNPDYRDEAWDEQPAAGDAAGQAIAARLRGHKLPMIDRVEVSVIQEAQPRWLAFLGGDFDVAQVPYEFATLAVPGGRLAPNLARRGLQLHKVVQSDLVYTYFNMDDAVVGGYTPAHVALRRAIGLAYDNAEEVRLLRRDLAVAAQGLVVPGVTGYDPQLHSAMGDFSPERARALLDLYGWLDRDGDGYRDTPEGQPFTLHFATQTDQTVRQFNELVKKRLNAVGLRVAFDRKQWPEQMKQARAGKLQIWSLSNSAGEPDAEDSFQIAYGPLKGEGNYGNFDLPAFNTLYEKIQQSPDGPERDAMIVQCEKLLAAYLPIKPHVHRIKAMLTQPWLVGYDGNPFVYAFWRYLDIDRTAATAARSAAMPTPTPTPAKAAR